MLLKDIKEVARKNDVKPGKLTKVKLILAIQEAEGNTACFNTIDNCPEDGCLWFKDCQ
jgi:hypothetical protein